MMKHILLGVTVCAATLLTTGEAKALPPVVWQCPEATWTFGYDIGEFIPLAPHQYKRALVYAGPSRVRSGAGFESDILFTLDTGAQVTVVGEAWDMGCNQWMRVLMGSNLYWMHGTQLQLL